MEYKAVYGRAQYFQEEVNAHLECGWELQGGISITFCGAERWFAQAMIKKIEVL